MNTSSAFLVALLLFCSLQLIETVPTCRLQGHLVHSAHDLLQKLGEEFPFHCRLYNHKISFPDSPFRAAKASHHQCHQALCVVNNTLGEVSKIFEDNDIPIGEGGVNWDNKTFDDFQNLQYQLLEEGSCLNCEHTSGVLSSYFMNVTAVIRKQDSAACGWMALKRDLLRILKSALQNHRSCFTWRHTH